MKRKIIAMSIILSTSLFSVEKNEDGSRYYNAEHLEQFQYNRGLKDGAFKGYKEGYRDALKFAKKQLRLYARKIEALEAGKYLKEYDRKITNPAVYQIRQGDSVRVVVRGCRIEKELSPDDILELPHYPVDAGVNAKFDFMNMDESSDNPLRDSFYSNSADIVSRDGNGFHNDRPSNPFLNSSSFLYLQNSQDTRKRLDVLNYTYTVEDNKIKVVFHTPEEKQRFLSNYMTNH